jgi:enamine deaminase RidA (YjgF/YER057c/UK114 family)
MEVEAKLEAMGLKIPAASPPVGTYVGAVQVGNLLFVSGHGPRAAGGWLYNGKVGIDYTVEQAYEAARDTMLNLLGTVQRTLGDLDRVERVVKLLGFVNVPEGFTETPKVINGASDLLVHLYGENGRHARSAIGVNALPNNIPVEIEMVLQVKAD